MHLFDTMATNSIEARRFFYSEREKAASGKRYGGDR